MTTAIAGVLAPVAAASAAWTPAESVSASANDIHNATLGFDAQGRALATWLPSTYVNGRFKGQGGRAATRAPQLTAFDPERTAPVFRAGPMLYGQTRAVGLDVRHGSWNRCGQQVDLRVRYGRSSGFFQTPASVIAAYRGVGGDGDPAVGTDKSGHVAAAWAQSAASCSRSIIRVARRRAPSSSFTAPDTLRGRGMNELPSIAVGGRGDIVVAWARRVGEGRTVIEARYRRAGGSWDALERLGEGTARGEVTTAVMQNGRAYVAWQRKTINETTGTSASTWVAVRPSGAGSFRDATRLEAIRTGVSYVGLRPILAVNGIHALIAWTGRAGTTWRVRVATAGSNGSFSSPETVSDAAVNAQLGGLSLLPDGTAAVSWAQLDFELVPGRALAALRPAGDSRFLPGELVSSSTRSVPLVALSPLTRQPTVTWTQHMGAPTTSAARLDVRLRASTREPPAP
ncbi:MAG: hypothetical protein F2832_06100 [Actinobacteria bacterium]|nr:hypothetical protein [Actinomycetota bacterium]